MAIAASSPAPSNAEGLVVRSVCFANAGLFPEGTQPSFTQKLLLVPVLGSWIARFAPQPYPMFRRGLNRVFGPNTRPSEAEMQEFWYLLRLHNGHRVVPNALAYLKERFAYRDRWVGALQHAGVPLCLINGAADPVSGTLVPQLWQQMLPDADLVHLDAAIGHYPPLEDPEGVLEAFFGFMQRHGFDRAIADLLESWYGIPFCQHGRGVWPNAPTPEY